ncbi:hypothetical protein H632_c2680p1 [Helicosporidium sp. ATCC 50920]|nr:hypothetical protein H632_c2680p1 [Helicosporidium sp. ATCC 50920]|eukprot:KDD72970.1 hypothetical protein H632_c2680p1 [Helicosporidium sp. ATCC 50920]
MPFAFRPVWLLFGDSITQYGFEPQGWGMHIASQYERRIDLINRGFGGYNTRWALELLPWVMEGVVKPQLATIFFGANDAALPDRTSYVCGDAVADMGIL